MADLKKLTDDVAARAALSAGKDMARNALDEILPRDADASKGTTEKGTSSRRWWIIARVVAAICVVIGVIGLFLAYWHWFLLAGAVGLAALYGYSRLRSRGRDKKSAKAKTDAALPESTRAATTASKPRSEADESARAAKREREADEARLRELEALRDAAAEREARAEREREVDDELAAMKARIKREP